ncbi:putative porin [Flavihumibacter sp. RY-1]|uniref:Porin n=1 Tax=Flavihumibacter fluminis TaxID=2909236 RepID=A0ABS9BD86_9BACT|nr:putative porin [Flavihumibacter fluminis]MCF1713522.1 putative porin [Flavihumibacter fluminis]
MLLRLAYSMLFLCLLGIVDAYAQNPMRRLPGMGGGGMRGGSTTQDSLKRRDSNEDSITIWFRYLDTSTVQRLDSSIVDFYKRFPVPANHVYLGNLGLAARPLGFNPILKSGWDPGFHAFDPYKLRLDQVRFFQTTRPYSELGYLLGSNAEQIINVMHTQNIKPNWNFAFQYNLVNSLGMFKNQSTNHSRYLFNSDYTSRNKRYHLYFIALSNSMQANENGGLQDDYDYMGDLVSYQERSAIPVQLGDYVPYRRNVLNSALNTGSRQRTTTYLLRQQYDLGRKDSIVTDSSVIPLFYPKLRIEYNLQYNRHRYRYFDRQPQDSFYIKNYDFLVRPANDFTIEESWNDVINDFSLYSFPDEKNARQFLKAGISLQNMTGTFTDGKRTFYNLFIHGEYRNKTRNQKWDLEANGKFYLAGYNNADFDLNASIKRYISKQLGYIQAGFQNVNRTPSYIFEPGSSFSLVALPSLNKENITRIYGSLDNPLKRWNLSASYYLVSNFSYFTDFYKPAQASALFNVLEVSAEKTFKVGRRWNWMARVQLQQRAGDGPVNMPVLFTHHRFGYEGTLGFKNLRFAAGLEGKYHTAYKADFYSPLLTRFYFQDTATLRLNFPDIAAYVHFRIRSFAAYVRAENLNTAVSRDGVFGFYNNNLAAPNYPYQGLMIRVGIYWSFVN